MSRRVGDVREHLQSELAARKKAIEGRNNSAGSSIDVVSKSIKGRKLKKSYLERRKELAYLAIKHVKESLPFGAANTRSGITAIPKVHQIMEKYLPMEETIPDIHQGKLAIAASIEALRKEQKFLELNTKEDKQLKAIVANYLMHFLFGNRLAKLDIRVENLRDLKEYACIIRTFQTGNCGDQVMLAIEYLLMNHLEEEALYPLKVFEAHKVNSHLIPRGSDPEDGHQLLLLGRLSIEDEPIGEDTSRTPDPLACDPWQEKIFLFLAEWHSEAPVGLRGSNFDFDNSVTLFHINNPAAAKKGLATLSAKEALNLGVTALEAEQWVSGFCEVLIRKSDKVEPAFLPIYTVYGLSSAQMKLIEQRQGRLINAMQFELASEHLKSVENGGIRENLGLQRVALTNMTTQKAAYIREREPAITLERDPANEQRYLATYEFKYHTTLQGILQEWAHLQAERRGEPILHLQPLQAAQTKRAESKGEEKEVKKVPVVSSRPGAV